GRDPGGALRPAVDARPAGAAGGTSGSAGIAARPGRDRDVSSARGARARARRRAAARDQARRADRRRRRTARIGDGTRSDPGPARGRARGRDRPRPPRPPAHPRGARSRPRAGPPRSRRRADPPRRARVAPGAGHDGRGGVVARADPGPAHAAYRPGRPGLARRVGAVAPRRRPAGRGARGGGVVRAGLASSVALSTFLFDLDGTLIDSIELILRSYRHTMRAHRGLEPPDEVWMKGLG